MLVILLGMGLALLLGVAVVALLGVLLFVRPLTWQRLRLFLLVPLAALGCAALILGALLLSRAAERFLGDDDFDRYRAIYGRDTSMSDGQMLSDGFYKGWAREVWLRAEPDAKQLAQMRAIPGLQPSALTQGDFAMLGQAHDFYWWYGADSQSTGENCPGARVRRSESVARWREVLVMECATGTSALPVVYILARGERTPGSSTAGKSTNRQH